MFPTKLSTVPEFGPGCKGSRVTEVEGLRVGGECGGSQEEQERKVHDSARVRGIQVRIHEVGSRVEIGRGVAGDVGKRNDPLGYDT